MNSKLKARLSYKLETEISDNVPDNFWVVLLSDNTEIYQSKDNFPENSWIRLSRFIKENNLSICGMAFSNKEFDHTKQINLENNADGYFYCKRFGKIMAANPYFSGFSKEEQGVGFLSKNTITIYWINDSRVTFVENRKIEEDKKNQYIGLILNG